MRCLLIAGLTSLSLLAAATPAFAVPGSRAVSQGADRVTAVQPGAAQPGAASAVTVVGPYPITQPAVTEPAGKVCSFGLGFTFPSQDLRETDYYNASGTLVRSFVTGPLIAQITNLSSGRSVVRSESGPGWFIFHPDGSLTIDAPEHIGVGFAAGDSPSHEFLITSGRAVINVSATGTKTLVVLDGTAEDMCVTLAS
jgi:hypothetical protein